VSSERKDNLFTPVHDLHRTRGSFGDQAADSVVALPGPLARLMPLIAAGMTGLSIGLFLRRSRANAPRRRLLR
jgi:hypothetical protein